MTNNDFACSDLVLDDCQLSHVLHCDVGSKWNTRILSSIVTLIPSGLPSRILNPYWTKWALAIVCFSFFFLYFFLATCAISRWSHSAFESTLNSFIVSYRIVLASTFRERNRWGEGSRLPRNLPPVIWWWMVSDCRTAVSYTRSENATLRADG